MTSQTAVPVLDHIVINARNGLDRVEQVFGSLGFALTPRGYHTLGTINHLAMFAGDYLELVGVPVGKEDSRPEVGQAPLGLNGLVLRSDDIEATYAQFQRAGAASDPPKSFSRPVKLPDGSTRDASFRTVSASGTVFPFGRMYFCQHLTPELVWRPELLTHQNGVTGIAELVAVTPDPSGLVGKLAEAIGAAAPRDSRIDLPGGFRVSYLDPAAYRSRFGSLARDPGPRAAMLGALAFRCADPARMTGFLQAAGVPQQACATGSDWLRAVVEEFDSLLEFRAG
jgi:hypothetical protein